jgi:patatin-like phospholipase/acyl hydrolase
LPAHYFEKKDEQGKVIKEYNLIDGGVCANNPVRAISRAKHIEKKCMSRIKEIDHKI